MYEEELTPRQKWTNAFATYEGILKTNSPLATVIKDINANITGAIHTSVPACLNDLADKGFGRNFTFERRAKDCCVGMQAGWLNDFYFAAYTFASSSDKDAYIVLCHTTEGRPKCFRGWKGRLCSIFQDDSVMKDLLAFYLHCLPRTDVTALMLSRLTDKMSPNGVVPAMSDLRRDVIHAILLWHCVLVQDWDKYAESRQT